MSKVKVGVKLEEGSQYQVVIKIGGQILHFQESGSQTIDLEAKTYAATIAGFQDPTNLNSTVSVDFKQASVLLSSIKITDRKFVKLLLVTVS